VWQQGLWCSCEDPLTPCIKIPDCDSAFAALFYGCDSYYEFITEFLPFFGPIFIVNLSPFDFVQTCTGRVQDPTKVV